MISFLCWFFLTPLFVFAAPVINEVFFNPSAGSDSGLEKIEIYNPDAASYDMSGWELYPDGIGYFVFPSSFSLGAKSFVLIHLKLTGINTANDLYHAATSSSNMGDSSGSVAIFRPGGRGKDTIVDFIRYHKPGSFERKTWESAAVEAGLWTAGVFVDVSALVEGNSIGLVADGLRADASSWKIYSLPSLGTANAELSGGESGDSASTSPSSDEAPGQQKSEAAPAPPPVPSLGAEAGTDAVVVAGSIVQFRGLAFGLDGELLPSARFLWNFGDGVVQEGKSRTHVYYFPGTYRAGLFVSSGEYTGSDWRIVTVVPPELTISEAKSGDAGFAELFNASSEPLDIGGMSLTDDANTVFRVPSGTVIGPNGAIVFPNVVTGLNPRSSLVLRDARASVLDAAIFSGALPAGASWERSGTAFMAQALPTPGKAPERAVPAPLSLGPASVRVPPFIPEAAASQAERNSALSEINRPAAASDPPEGDSGAEYAAAASSAGRLLPAAVIFSFLGAAAFFIVKRTAA